jgi:HTH-type transcriptional regulator, transcriptional repressor of NAD biosynthesis genes
VTERFRVGLVVGKFSPLHHGHELVLNTALERCQRVLALSYSNPELPGCGAAQRGAWLAELFPEIEHLALDEAVVAALRAQHPALPLLPANDAPELEHRLFVARICSLVWGLAVDAVFTSEHYGDGFAAELSRQFGAPVAHVLVDLERSRVPISASAIRARPELGPHFLSPVVRASFIRRVCLLGGESSGKTTLTRALAARFETSHVEEYGRELWLERGGALAYDDFLRIARTQLAHEEQAARSAHAVTFCDTSPLTTLFYCLDQFGRAEPELYALAERAYDLTLLCAADFPFVQDGTRRDAAFTAEQHAFYERELERRGVAWLLVSGPLEARLALVEQAFGVLLS